MRLIEWLKTAHHSGDAFYRQGAIDRRGAAVSRLFTRYPLIVVVAFAFFAGCDTQPSQEPKASNASQSSDPSNAQDLEKREGEEVNSTQRTAFVKSVRPKVEAFCGDCHAMPRPSSSTKEMWVEEVNQGFALYGESGRSDLEVPPYDDVLKFFQYQAPRDIKLPTTIDNYPKCKLNLVNSTVRLPGTRPPGVTNVRWIDLGIGDSPALIYCDIGTGMVKAHWPGDQARDTKRLATLLQPVHTEPCDLNGDGLTDLVVADIGEFNAEDSQLGRVVWLRRKSDSESFEKIVIRDELSRIADVQPADFDADGDVDLLVGIFGWRKTGQIILLENQGLNAEGIPEFTSRVIEERHGAVNVPWVDLNGDGHLDFVALLSQEHEVVEAYLNDGEGHFDLERIWSAPDPAYGSSGIELVDMDGDGDQDVLMTNGDSFDRGAKPYHGVQWLENTGTYPYQHHAVCEMPGVLNATAADFDSDGDQDIVAVALLAGSDFQQLAERPTSSIVFLEQVEPDKFERYQLEAQRPNHISLEVGDFNADSKIDIAVGTFLRSGGGDQPDLMVWSQK